jgi:hypothetical protein
VLDLAPPDTNGRRFVQSDAARGANRDAAGGDRVLLAAAPARPRRPDVRSGGG